MNGQERVEMERMLSDGGGSLIELKSLSWDWGVAGRLQRLNRQRRATTLGHRWVDSFPFPRFQFHLSGREDTETSISARLLCIQLTEPPLNRIGTR